MLRTLTLKTLFALIACFGLLSAGSLVAQERTVAPADQELAEEGEEPTSQPTEESVDPRGPGTIGVEQVQEERNEGDEDDVMLNGSGGN